MLSNLFKVLGCVFLVGCQSLPAIKTVSKVDLNRFMGDWYVIAAIPTFIEKAPYGPIESYALNTDGSIATTFRFRQGGADGPLKVYQPTGYVVANTGNAEWRMQFLWPFKSEYLIAHLDAQYSETIIARNKRDYVWIMARTPTLSDTRYQGLVKQVQDMGYDTQKLVKFPHP